MTSGTTMRFARFDQKPPVPSLLCSTRAKKPAMKKNSDMRKTCVTNAASLSAALGELSLAAQRPGGQFGMKDSAAWNATPSSSAKPRTASRACRRSEGSFIVVLLEIVAAAGRDEQRQDEGGGGDGELDGERDPEGRVPDGRGPEHVIV